MEILCNQSTECIYSDALIAISLHSYPADLMGRTKSRERDREANGGESERENKSMGAKRGGASELNRKREYNDSGWEGVQRVKIWGRARDAGKDERTRSADGTGMEREFNSTVDYAASLPDYCRYTFPFCADEGITLRVYYVRAADTRGTHAREILCNTRRQYAIYTYIK